MKAYRMHSVGNASFGSIPDPDPEAGELVLAPIVTGLCSTDVHVLFEGAAEPRLPLTLGHEVVGQVLEVRPGPSWEAYGTGAAPYREGDIVCVEPLFPCGRCFRCLRGMPNLCQRASHLGISRDGCWADLMTVPTTRAFRVPDGLPPERAVFVEPLACGLHFIDKAGVGPGRTVVVLGAGPAGLLTVQAAKAAGAFVLASEPHPTRRALATSLGADIVVDPAIDDLEAVVLSATAGLGADAIIEITGAPEGVGQAVEIARPGSTIVLAGICGHPATPIDTNAIVTRELTIAGAVASRWHFDRSMRMVADGRIAVEPLVSLLEPWSELDRLLSVAREDRDVCKILIEHRN